MKYCQFWSAASQADDAEMHCLMVCELDNAGYAEVRAVSKFCKIAVLS